MKFLCVAAALATASAFTTSGGAFTTITPSVGEKAVNNVFADNSAHRTRRATIVMDGKANGTFYVMLVLGSLDPSYVRFLEGKHVPYDGLRASLVETYSAKISGRCLPGKWEIETVST